MNLRLALLLTMLFGFISLSYEIVWIRAFSFAVGGAAYAFAILLSAYLMGIALGSYIVRDICSEIEPRAIGDYKTLALFVAFSNIVGVLVVPVMGALVTTGIGAAIVVVPVIIAAGALGAQLPLISHYCIAPDSLAGENISYIYVANITGSVLGSLLTGFVLFDIWSMSTISTVLGAVGMLLAFAVYAAGAVTPKDLRISVALTLILMGTIAFGTPLLYSDIWAKLQFKEDYSTATSFKHIVENRSGVITVDQQDKVYGGGIYDGQFSLGLVDDTNMIVRSYALGLVHPKPRRVLVVGLASGSWSAVVANHPDVESVSIVEINPGYLELIEQYEPHHKLLNDAHVEIIIDDARRWLRHNPELKFDAIVVNTTFHWRAQASNLLSIEWMQLISEHLAEGGVYFFNATASRRAERTALESFPHCIMIINNLVCSHSPLDYSPERWLKELSNYSLWGTPVLDLDQASHRETLERLKTFSAPVDTPPAEGGRYIYTQEYLENRTRSATVITDNNMGEEW